MPNETDPSAAAGATSNPRGEVEPSPATAGGTRGGLGVALSEVWEAGGADESVTTARDGSVGPAEAAVTGPGPGAATESAEAREEGSAIAATRIIAIANQKGGVGKSTTAVSLGAALADLGHDVLVVDLDPQGNASTGMGIRHVARDVTTYEILLLAAPLEDAIVPTAVERLFAIPSTIDLAGAEIELVSQFSREMRLAKALEPVRSGHYDFILLDCPPSLGLLTINALAAADELLVPIQCEYYALEGLGQLLRNVRLIQQNVNSRLRLTGIVMTMYDARTKLSDQVVAEVRRYFGSRVYDSVIPRTVRLSEAPGFGLPITAYDPLSRGAIMYRSLAREVAARPPEGEPVPIVADLPEVIAPEPRSAPASAPADDEPAVQEQVEPEAEVVEVAEPEADDVDGDEVDEVEPEIVGAQAVEPEPDHEEPSDPPTKRTDETEEPGTLDSEDQSESRKRFRLFRKGGQE